MHAACPHCSGHVLDDGQMSDQVVTCPYCHQQFQMPSAVMRAQALTQSPATQRLSRIQQGTKPRKNPGLAAVLSFFWTGLGQIYNGQIGKGIALIVLQFVNTLLMLLCIGFVTFCAVWIWGMYDAYSEAERLNAAAVRSRTA